MMTISAWAQIEIFARTGLTSGLASHATCFRQGWPGPSSIRDLLLGAERGDCKTGEDHLKGKNGQKTCGRQAIDGDADQPPKSEAIEQNDHREQRERPHFLPEQPKQEQGCYPDESTAQGGPDEVTMIDGVSGIAGPSIIICGATRCSVPTTAITAPAPPSAMVPKLRLAIADT